MVVQRDPFNDESSTPTIESPGRDVFSFNLGFASFLYFFHGFYHGFFLTIKTHHLRDYFFVFFQPLKSRKSTCTPPKFNMEPENDGFQKASLFPGTSFQVPC